MKFSILVLSIIICLQACNESYIPKPKGYKKIVLPASHNYQSFSQPKFPFSFEYPTYASLQNDSTFFNNNPQKDDWVNIDFKNYNCKIYLSYSDVNGLSQYKKLQPDGSYKDSIGKNSFDKLVQDAFNLTSKHEVKASAKDDKKITAADGSGGIYFKVSGIVASPIQFFITDTTKHFIRGALYYDASPNPDSTRDITNFIEKDIEHLIKTFRWNN